MRSHHKIYGFYWSLCIMLMMPGTIISQIPVSDIEPPPDSTYVLSATGSPVEPSWKTVAELLSGDIAPDSVGISQANNYSITLDPTQAGSTVIEYYYDTGLLLATGGNSDVNISEQEWQSASFSSVTPTIPIPSDTTRYELYLNGMRMTERSTLTHISQFKIVGNEIQFFESLDTDDLVLRTY